MVVHSIPTVALINEEGSPERVRVITFVGEIICQNESQHRIIRYGNLPTRVDPSNKIRSLPTMLRERV